MVIADLRPCYSVLHQRLSCKYPLNMTRRKTIAILIITFHDWTLWRQTFDSPLMVKLGENNERDWKSVTMTLQALSLVEKMEPFQVRLTLRSRDQRSMWMQDGLHGFLHGIEWNMVHGHLDYFQKLPCGGRPNTKLGDHGTLNAHNRWFILFYHVWGPAWINIHWNSTWLRTRSLMTSHYTRGSVTTLHDSGGGLGWPLDTFFWALTISWSRLLARVWSGPTVG